MAEPDVHQVEVVVGFKKGVNDPETRSASTNVELFGKGTTLLTKGKYFLLDIAAESPEQARAKAQEMSRKLLANPVMESFRTQPLQESREHFLASNKQFKDGKYKVEVVQTPKAGVNNAPALVVSGALHQIGFPDANIASSGSYYLLSVPGENQAEALRLANEVTRRTLINTVLHRFDMYPSIKPLGDTKS